MRRTPPRQSWLADWAHSMGERAARDASVRLVYVFGSWAKGRPREESDVDVAVWLDRDTGADRTARLRHAVRLLAGAVPSHLLDVVVVNDAPPELRFEILRHRHVVYERSEEDRVAFAFAALRDYQDDEHRRAFYFRNRLTRIKTETANDGKQERFLAEIRRTQRLLGQA